MTFWNLVRFAHVLGVAMWLGGMLFLGLIAVPAARASGDRGASRALITNVAKRFGVIGGGVQCENQMNSSGSTSIPASSRDSRAAALRAAVVGSPSGG